MNIYIKSAGKILDMEEIIYYLLFFFHLLIVKLNYVFLEGKGNL